MDTDPFCSFRSQATKVDWWFGQVVIIALAIVWELAVTDMINHGVWPLYVLVLPVLWVVFALTANRLRDAGLSPWLSVAVLVPVANLVLWLTCGFRSSAIPEHER
ncbi:MAG: DUF805 domain-containing protein [Chloroflexi bacterium]|nr:DUF805 domain-containing protein [Chloroflexota bacterium]